MDCSNSSSEILFHGLPSKSKRPCIRKQIASFLSSQLIVLFLQNSHLERYLANIFSPVLLWTFRNSCSASKKPLEIFRKFTKGTHGESYFSKVAGFHKSSQQRCFVKKVFLERCLQNSQEKTCARDSIVIKLQA